MVPKCVVEDEKDQERRVGGVRGLITFAIIGVCAARCEDCVVEARGPIPVAREFAYESMSTIGVVATQCRQPTFIIHYRDIDFFLAFLSTPNVELVATCKRFENST